MGLLYLYRSGSLNLLEPSGPIQACNGIALPFESLHYECGLVNDDNEKCQNLQCAIREMTFSTAAGQRLERLANGILFPAVRRNALFTKTFRQDLTLSL
jgi:hypothetical protein